MCVLIIFISFDIRNNVLSIFTVSCSTGRYLMSGNQNGTVSVWDLTSAPVPKLNSDPILPASSTYLAHSDTVNGLRYVPIAQCIAVFHLACVAWWLVHRTCNREVAGSSPGRSTPRAALGKLFTHTCLCSPSSINWYRHKLGTKQALHATH